MIIPSLGSTVAFVVVVLAVCSMFVLAVRHSSEGAAAVRQRHTILAVVGVGIVLATTAILAETGVVRTLAGGPALMLFFVPWNVLALVIALSPLGRRMAARVPIAALVGFHAFRLPLELVLHRWYEEGVLPIQMTYSGDNFDIVTGILAVLVGLGLWREKLPRSAVWIFNFVGLGLLVAVVRIAVLSSPVPFRTYLDEPSVQLAFHAPSTWIVPICVAGALMGHLVTFRWLLLRPQRSTGSRKVCSERAT